MDDFSRTEELELQGNIGTGFARSTPFVQQWLNSSDGITEWRELNENWIEFRFSRNVEIPVVPRGVYFDAAEMDAAELEECRCI